MPIIANPELASELVGTPSPQQPATLHWQHAHQSSRTRPSSKTLGTTTSPKPYNGGGSSSSPAALPCGWQQHSAAVALLPYHVAGSSNPRSPRLTLIPPLT